MSGLRLVGGVELGRQASCCCKTSEGCELQLFYSTM